MPVKLSVCCARLQTDLTRAERELNYYARGKANGKNISNEFIIRLKVEKTDARNKLQEHIQECTEYRSRNVR